MVDVDIYTINNKEYMLLKEIELNNIKYLYLVNTNNEEDYIFRKILKEDSDYILPLDNEEEVKKVSLLILNNELKEN